MPVRSLLLALACASLVAPAVADELRPAQGKPCGPNEKTYFESDGVTPFGCVPAGGPAYEFEVYAGGNLLWRGELRSDQAEVRHDLTPMAASGKAQRPQLVFKRDLVANPAGHVVFLGEARQAGMERVDGPWGAIQVPREQQGGWRVVVAPRSGEVDMDLGKLTGAAVAENDYRLVVRLK